MGTDDRLGRAEELYQRAIFGGDSTGLGEAGRLLDAVDADLSVARGKLIHARFLERRESGTAIADPSEVQFFERAAELYEALGDRRGLGEATFWIGCFYQVVMADGARAVPVFERSAELAAQAGDKLTLSYALRHLGFADHEAGRLDAAKERFTESVRLRREVGFLPGVAANLIGLVYVAAEQGHRDEAIALAAEARAVADECGADRIIAQAEEALRHVTAAGS
jgi:tetratricopeptide (TPR) repeat protein